MDEINNELTSRGLDYVNILAPLREAIEEDA